MTHSLPNGERGMNKEIYKLDIEWQYMMLSHHVAAILKDIDDGLFPSSNHFDALRRRLEIINRLRDSDEKECESFARPHVREEDSISINTWPSSQLCMECEHGVFIMSEDLPSSTYACREGVQLGPCESKCYSWKEKLNEIQE